MHAGPKWSMLVRQAKTKRGIPMNQQKTGELIRALRLEKQMTQKQLADALGLSDRTVSKWERGVSQS